VDQPTRHARRLAPPNWPASASSIAPRARTGFGKRPHASDRPRPRLRPRHAGRDHRPGIGRSAGRLRRALADVAAVASIDLKADEPACSKVASRKRNGWTIRFYSGGRTGAVDVPNPSETVRKHTGTPSVSEAAALLAAGADQTHLIHRKTQAARPRRPQRHRLHRKDCPNEPPARHRRRKPERSCSSASARAATTT
jgi:hypothetical protein